MTDERDPRAPETPETGPASDLPTPAEDRSATTALTEAESPRPAAGEAAEASVGGEGAADREGETAAAKEDAAGEASASDLEIRTEPVDEGEAEAASAGSAAAGEGGTAEERSAEKDLEEDAETRVVAAEDAEPRAPATPAAGEAPEEDMASAAEDDSRRYDEEERHAAPESVDVAAETSSGAAAERPAAASEAEADATEVEVATEAAPSGDAEGDDVAPPPADVAAEPSSEPTPPAAAGPAAASEGPTTVASEPAAEPPPFPESVPSPAAESSPGSQSAAAEVPSAAERPTAAEAEPTAAAPEPPAAAAEAEPEPPAAEPEPPAAAETEAEPRAAAELEPPTPAAKAEPQKPAAAAEPEEPEDPAVTELRRAKEEGTTVEGKVIGWNRGGFHVVVGEITAFCPSSEMELGRPRNPQSYVDRELRFRVVKLQKKGRRVVLSRAAVLGEERQRVVGELTAGAVVRGRVTSLPDFGAFVDLGGVEGLVHVSEISRGRVKSPKEALQVGQEVEVKVLKVEQEGERISLSMKDLEPDPWQGVAERYARGEKFPGKVARRADFGLFVELEPEVEGLVHVSQLPPGTELGDPSLDPGRTIDVWVREVDRKRQRIALSLREVPSEDPWKSAAKRFPEGEMVEGTVESIAPFGVFVNLAPGLTGLLPGSQTGLPKGTSAARAFTPGQKVRVQVLTIDSRRKRISLGREGSRVEATRGDLQEFKKQQREREQEAPTAMAAAFARLREDGEGPETS